jgi:hypothetical protein
MFSEPMDFKNGPDEFSVLPSGKTRSIIVADSLSTSILMDFTSDTYIGASGEPSYVVLEGLKSAKGIELGGINRVSLYKEISSLKNIKVYPQPLKPQHDKLIFANLPGDVEITIYNMNGRPVRHLMAEAYYGGLKWDLKDDNGNTVTSGIYLFNITWKNTSEQGKIVIIR